MTLRIRQEDYEAMRRDCEAAYPAEACGILLGKNDGTQRIVSQIFPCHNAANDPSRQYSIDPVELIRIQRQVREHGLEIVGFYHSHPDHPAQPSPTDFEDAHWIGCSYVITTVQQGEATHTRCFVLGGTTEEDKRFSEEIGLIEDQK